MTTQFFIWTLAVISSLNLSGCTDARLDQSIALCTEAMELNANQLRLNDQQKQKLIREVCAQAGAGHTPEQWQCVIAAMKQDESYVKALIRPGPEETWLLVQTAADIPRSIGVFNKQGWTVTPVPCDYNAVPPEWLPGLSATEAFEELYHALHEWIGLVVYYITGKTNRLFPAPPAMDRID